MALRWGPDFVLIYNDAYRPILGDKHPWALGRPAREAWSEVWSQIEAAHRAIYFEGAPAMFAEDMLLPVQRHATTWENARFTLSYSPINDATSPTGVGGILITAVETTERFTAAEALRRSDERYSLDSQPLEPSGRGTGTSSPTGCLPTRFSPNNIRSTPHTPQPVRQLLHSSKASILMTVTRSPPRSTRASLQGMFLRPNTVCCDVTVRSFGCSPAASANITKVAPRSDFLEFPSILHTARRPKRR